VSDIQTALDLAKKIEERAEQIASGVRLEVALHCAGKREFMAIMLEAVERKIMAMRREAQRKAAGIGGHAT
jgi:hypothetical protein